MKQGFSFAVTLHRVFDSAPPDSSALFFRDNRQLFPIRKSNGTYVFSNIGGGALALSCPGFEPQTAEAEEGAVTPIPMYPGRLFAPPAGWRLVTGKAEPGRTLYFIDTRYELKLIKHDFNAGFVRIRSRKGFVGGCLLFSSENSHKAALILEKRSPDIFYVSGLSRDYTGAEVRRVFLARADSLGEYRLVIPEAFEPEAESYL